MVTIRWQAPKWVVMRNWQHSARLFVASVVTLLGYIALNVWIHRTYPARCADCHARIGFPFAYYDAGGFAGDDGLLWFGVAADLVTVLGIAIGVVLAFERYIRRWNMEKARSLGQNPPAPTAPR